MKILSKEIIISRLVALASIAVLIGFDRLTKWLIDANMYVGQSVSLVKVNHAEVLNFTYVLNTGAAFSILEGQRLLLTVLPALFLVGALVLLLSDRVKSKLALWALTLIIAGGAGNLIDRIFNGGKVIDFIDFRFINFAIFNFADICAVFGTFMLLFFMIREEAKALKKKKAEKQETQNE